MLEGASRGLVENCGLYERIPGLTAGMPPPRPVRPALDEHVEPALCHSNLLALVSGFVRAQASGFVFDFGSQIQPVVVTVFLDRLLWEDIPARVNIVNAHKPPKG